MRGSSSQSLSLSTISIAAMAALASAGLTYAWMSTKRQGTKAAAASVVRAATHPAESEAGHTLFARALHNVNPILQMAGRAKIQRQAAPLSRDTPGKTNVVRIALTGGPCAGKSSALEHLRQRATALGFDVYTAPEVATLLFNSGIVYPAHSEGQVVEFQKSLCRIQLHLERNLTSIIQGTGRPSILIFDRGLLDVKGYIPKEMWSTVLQDLDGDGRGVTEEYCLKRYAGVIHLVTAANGAAEFYKSGATTDDSGNTVIRRESVEEALDLDEKMQTSWKDHPRHFIIRNEAGKTFQDKLDAAASAIISLAEQTHPKEYDKAKVRASTIVK